MSSGVRIGDNLARLGREIGDNLEKKAIYDEAQAIAPELNAAYRNAFNLLQSGNTGEGYNQLFSVATKYATNPIVAKMNEMALRAGGELSDAFLRKQIASSRTFASGNGLTPGQVDAQFDGGAQTIPGSENEVDVTGELPTNEPDLTADPTGGVIPNMGGIVNDKLPKVQTSPSGRMASQSVAPSVQQGQSPAQIAALPPQQYAEASQGAIAGEKESQDGFDTFDVPEKLRPYFMGASQIGLPMKSKTSVSDTKNVSSKGTYSRGQTSTKTTPEVDEKIREGWQAMTKAASNLEASAAVQDAIKKSGGFDNLQVAPTKQGLGGKESYALTWPGNSEKAVPISKEDYNSFLAIKSLPVTASQTGAKFFGASSPATANGKARVPNEIVSALKANPNDPKANQYLKETFGENAGYLRNKIIGQ